MILSSYDMILALSADTTVFLLAETPFVTPLQSQTLLGTMDRGRITAALKILNISRTVEHWGLYRLYPSQLSLGKNFCSLCLIPYMKSWRVAYAPDLLSLCNGFNLTKCIYMRFTFNFTPKWILIIELSITFKISLFKWNISTVPQQVFTFRLQISEYKISCF